MIRVLFASLLLTTVLVSDPVASKIPTSLTQTPPAHHVLVEDPMGDVAVDSLDIRRLDATLFGASTLELGLLMQGTTLREARAGHSIHYQFQEWVQLSRAAQPRDAPPTQPVVLTLKAFPGSTALVAAPGTGEIKWGFYAYATVGRIPILPLETAQSGRLPWTPVAVKGSVAGPLITWRVGLGEMRDLFPAELPRDEAWTLSHPFALNQLITDPVVEGTLAWATDSAHSKFRRDRGPDTEWGASFSIPRQEDDEASAGRQVLVEDAFNDVPVEAMDIRILDAAVKDHAMLELGLRMQNPFYRGTYAEVPPYYEFFEYVQIAVADPAHDARPMTIRLGALARPTMGQTDWTFSADAIHGPLASHALETVAAVALQWIPLTVNASADGAAIRWRLDLLELSTSFQQELPRDHAWTMSHPFADSRMRVEPFTEAVLHSITRSPYDDARRDRAPDAGYGRAFAIPALEPAPAPTEPAALSEPPSRPRSLPSDGAGVGGATTHGTPGPGSMAALACAAVGGLVVFLLRRPSRPCG